MYQLSPPLNGWGPDRRRAAISITFDNLGEAAELERGLWPADKPLGQHYSVTRVLPTILHMLTELELTGGPLMALASHLAQEIKRYRCGKLSNVRVDIIIGILLLRRMVGT